MIENNGKSTLFCRERNLELEKWDGFMHGVDGAKKTFGFDECFDITEKEKTGVQLHLHTHMSAKNAL